MTPYILILTVLGGLGTSSSPTILRFSSEGGCIATGAAIEQSIKRQTVEHGYHPLPGVNAMSPAVSYECVAELEATTR